MMKFLNLLIFSLLAISLNANAQRLQQSRSAKADTTLLKAPKAVFVELLGPGLLFSGNFDSRFSKRPDGLGIRAGISYASIDDTNLFTFPVQLNYLLGKDEKFFEIGFGATYGTASYNFDDDSDSDSQVIGTMTFGYRKQPINGGFMFRGGISPVFAQGDFIPYWPYISFGYSF